MNTKSLCVCLITALTGAVLSGCAGSNPRLASAAGDAGVLSRGAAPAAGPKASPKPGARSERPGCTALDPQSMAALNRLAQASLWELWEELARAGVAGAPPLFAVEAALLPRPGPQAGVAAAPLLCPGVPPEQSGFAILLMPMLPEMRGRRLHPAADLLLPDAPSSQSSDQDVRFWARVDPERLLRQLPGGRAPLRSEQERRRLLIPLDGGSLLRLAPPNFGAQSGVLLEGAESEPELPRPISASVYDDLLDYRFRLPTGTARVLIVHF